MSSYAVPICPDKDIACEEVRQKCAGCPKALRTPASGAAVKEGPTLTLRHATLVLQAMRLAAANGNFGDPVYSTAYIDGSIEDLALYATPQPPTAEPGQTHSDDLAVDKFAAALKGKLARQREKGYSGWETCPVERLQEYLFRHIHKGDPIDVGNFAMMLWNRGNPTAYEDQWVFDITGKWPGILAGQTNEQGRAADVAVPANLGDIVRRYSVQMGGGYRFSDTNLGQFVKAILAHQPPASPVAVPEMYLADGVTSNPAWLTFKHCSLNPAIEVATQTPALPSADVGQEGLTKMRAAFRTTATCGPDKLYEMRFAFRDMETLHAADDEWRKFAGLSK